MIKMMKKCFLCGRYAQTERHHLFGGAYRKKADRDRLYVDLCHTCHNEPPNGAHFNRDVMQKLHEYGQLKWMSERHATVSDFRKEYGQNYLEVDANDEPLVRDGSIDQRPRT